MAGKCIIKMGLNLMVPTLRNNFGPSEMLVLKVVETIQAISPPFLKTFPYSFYLE